MMTKLESHTAAGASTMSKNAENASAAGPAPSNAFTRESLLFMG
jgi:hypothetical protein